MSDARRRASAAPALVLIASCSALEGPDLLTGQAASPDGAVIARAWCTDFCDVPTSRTITISPASRTVALAPAGEGMFEGDLPDEDKAARIHLSDGEEDRGGLLALRWTGPRTLVIEGPCLSDGNFQPLQPRRHGDVDIVFHASGAGSGCPAAAGAGAGAGS